MSTTFADNLRRFRKAKGLTQDQLADRAAMNGRQLSRYENGHFVPPSRTIRRLAEALGVTVEELSEEDPHQRMLELIPDQELLEQFQAVCRMDEEDRTAVKRLLGALVMKQQMQQMLSARAS